MGQPEHAEHETKDLTAAQGRHSRKCKICRHSDREDMEQEYRDWRSPYEIAQDYKVQPRALYRHLEAMGLPAKRSASVRMILERILERGAETPITGDTILRAVRAYTCLTDDIKWVEPERHPVVIRQDSPNPDRLPIPIHQIQNLIDTNAIRK